MSWQYLTYPRNPHIESKPSKTVVSVHLKTTGPNQTNPGGGDKSQASGATRRSTLDFESFNQYYGLPNEKTNGFQYNPLIRPSVAHAQSIAAAASGATAGAIKHHPKQGGNQAAPIITLSDKVAEVPMTEMDRVTGLVTLKSLVKQIDSQLVTNDSSIWSGKPVNLDASFQILDKLYEDYPDQKPQTNTGGGNSQRGTAQLMSLQPAHYYFTPFLNHQVNGIFDQLHTEFKFYAGYHELYAQELKKALPTICGVKSPGQHGTPAPLPPDVIDPSFAQQLTTASAHCNQQSNENMELIEAHFRAMYQPFIDTKTAARRQLIQQQQQLLIQQQHHHQQHQQQKR